MAMLFFKAATLLDLKLLNGTKSGQRVAAWTGTAERLNQPNIGFKVNQRSVRENFDKMMREFNSKEKERKTEPVALKLTTVRFTEP